MTDTQHTPGPWECFPAKDSDGDVTISIRGHAEFIATMDTRSIDGGPYVLPPSGEANARLIAAAPDLLEACELILFAAKEPGENPTGATYQSMQSALASIIFTARAAIAKAKGE